MNKFFESLYLDAYLVDIYDNGNLMVSLIMNPVSEVNISEGVARLYDDSDNQIVIYYEGGEIIEKEDRHIVKVGVKEYSFIPI